MPCKARWVLACWLLMHLVLFTGNEQQLLEQTFYVLILLPVEFIDMGVVVIHTSEELAWI